MIFVSKKSFENFYKENIDKIYRFVFFRVGYDKALAEDLVSEIFLKALEHFSDYDEKISQSAWLFTIGKNHLINHWRNKKPSEILAEQGNEDDDFILDKVWFNKAKENEIKLKHKVEVNDELLSLLAKLEFEEREIVTLHYLFGYSYVEVGQIVGKNEIAVKVAAYRAIKKLKNYKDFNYFGF